MNINSIFLLRVSQATRVNGLQIRFTSRSYSLTSRVVHRILKTFANN